LVETIGNERAKKMEQITLYKGFRIRAYEDWSGLWLAETKKPLGRRPGAGDHDDTDAEHCHTLRSPLKWPPRPFSITRQVSRPVANAPLPVRYKGSRAESE
jgi:hypothetical protein